MDGQAKRYLSKITECIHLQVGILKVNVMDLTSFRVYMLNLSAITVSTFDILEDSLKIILLVVSIGYTVQKWYEVRNKND
tara:strand:+ start:24 stop:263 length:240 start_codon:yes stop_codon:yes gene_type:complete